MSEIIDHNFGKDDREHVRRFCRLLGLLEDYEANVRADPVKYLNQAGAEIARLRAGVFEAWETVALARRVQMRFDDPPELKLPKVISVYEHDYFALRAAYEKIARLAGMS